MEVPQPGAVEAQDTGVLGSYVRDLITLNRESRNFRVFGPDETASNALSAVFEASGRRWMDPIDPVRDAELEPDGPGDGRYAV